jgi:O-methyltransferase domain/Dimerisation domain
MRLFRRLFGRSDLKKKRAEPFLYPQNFQTLLGGYRTTALLFVAAKLKLPDLLANGSRSSEDLADTLKAHAPTLRRLLRGLVALGIFSEEAGGRFQLTGLGTQLQSDNARYSAAILNGEEYAPAWNNLFHSVMTGETAFDDAFGESPWTHRQKNARLNDCFNALLAHSTSAAVRSILEVCDFSRYRIVADVGGGQGTLLAAILKVHPALHGILFDQPHVVAAAGNVLQTAGVGGRCRIVEGNFFEKIPIEADAIILKSILHDWDDEKCLAILKNCHASLQAGQALLVVEKIMPDQVADNPGIILGDLHMLAVTGGMERTADEYHRLFAAAGFKPEKIISTRGEHNILEALRA